MGLGTEVTKKRVANTLHAEKAKDEQVGRAASHPEKKQWKKERKNSNFHRAPRTGRKPAQALSISSGGGGYRPTYAAQRDPNRDRQKKTRVNARAQRGGRKELATAKKKKKPA